MKSIDELIAEICPDGVEYKPLGEVCEIVKGEQLNRNSLLEYGQYPVINGGIEPSGYWDHYNFTKDYITVSQGGASAGYVNWIDSDFWAGAHCFVIERNESIVCYRYIYHMLKHCEYWLMKSQVGAGIPSVSKETLSQVAIPIPTLPIQKEIVRILDGFTGLIEELEAELAARRKQYEQYRDKLLALGDGVERKPLGTLIISLKTGLNPRTNFKLNTKESVCPYVTGKDVFNNTINITDRTDKIESNVVALINKRACIENGDVLFASTGTGTVGRMAIVCDYHGDWAVSETMYCLKPQSKSVSSRFLMYSLSSSNAVGQYEPRISRGSVPHLRVDDLLNVKIATPPLAEQKRIVEILDKFDALCNDETAGLAAEIAARKKQYEYYRDKLLTFKRKAS